MADDNAMLPAQASGILVGIGGRLVADHQQRQRDGDD
jgi:hypothetical protein